MRTLAPRILVLAVAVLLGASAPIPRAILLAAPSDSAGAACCVVEPEAFTSGDCGGCVGFAICDSESPPETSSDDTLPACARCVCCACGIGVLSALPGLVLPEATRQSFAGVAAALVSADLLPASPPPEVDPFFV